MRAIILPACHYALIIFTRWRLLRIRGHFHGVIAMPVYAMLSLLSRSYITRCFRRRQGRMSPSPAYDFRHCLAPEVSPHRDDNNIIVSTTPLIPRTPLRRLSLY